MKKNNMVLPYKMRFIEMLSILDDFEPKNILDIGGNERTANWFKIKFPKSNVVIFNKSITQVGSYENFIIGDAQSFNINKKFDLIFAGELIEHLHNPDGFLESCKLALNDDGYLIITTPNMACFHNRIFLLFGLAPLNYTPSIKYRVGNPFHSHEEEFGEHKSVFTYKGLKELLNINDFRVIAARGYEYSDGKSLFRVILNKLLLHNCREGMILACKRY